MDSHTANIDGPILFVDFDALRYNLKSNKLHFSDVNMSSSSLNLLCGSVCWLVGVLEYKVYIFVSWVLTKAENMINIS